MNKISNITAVLLALRTLGDDVFSIHDITTMIREELANGTYELVGGPIIFHEEVKDAFLELINNVYTAEYMTRHAAGGYREFQRVSGQTPVQASTTVNQTPAPVAPTPTTVFLKPNTPTALTPNNFGATLTNLILTYLSNGPKSTKQIQSRFKSHALTCEQIKRFLDACNLTDNNTASLPVSKVMSR